MHPLHKLLEKYRKNSKDEREKGTYFEHLIRDFLQNDPVYASQFEKIWTFKDWAKENSLNGNDTGIDLVAKRKNEEGFCAIQCKFYAENHTIQRGDLDSFLAQSGTTHFTSRIVVDTTRGEWGKNARAVLVDQAIPIKRLGLIELEESAIDWTIYAQNDEVKFKPKKDPHDHQKTAFDKTCKGFESSDRGKLVMACGTGKTFTSLKIAESVAGRGKTVLYLVPSLALMSQTVPGCVETPFIWRVY